MILKAIRAEVGIGSGTKTTSGCATLASQPSFSGYASDPNMFRKPSDLLTSFLHTPSNQKLETGMAGDRYAFFPLNP